MNCQVLQKKAISLIITLHIGLEKIIGAAAELLELHSVHEYALSNCNLFKSIPIVVLNGLESFFGLLIVIQTKQQHFLVH